MARKNNNKKYTARPIEKHDTAAWANIERTRPVSNVTIPSELEVSDAKAYVDTNEK